MSTLEGIAWIVWTVLCLACVPALLELFGK